jgi:hypothetical protein
MSEPFSTIGGIAKKEHLPKMNDSTALYTFKQYIKVFPESDCWFWIGLSGKHYGRFFYQGKYQQAHRVSFKLHREDIPEGLNVLHTCDNTLCVNPSHLFLGTQQDNVDDMVAKGQCFMDKRPRRGTEATQAKLNEAEVHEIKFMLGEGYRHRDIASFFGVARQTITNIATGHRWSHIK